MPSCPHSAQVKMKLFMLLHSHYNKVFGHDDVSTVWCLPWSGDVHDGREEAPTSIYRQILAPHLNDAKRVKNVIVHSIVPSNVQFVLERCHYANWHKAYCHHTDCHQAYCH